MVCLGSEEIREQDLESCGGIWRESILDCLGVFFSSPAATALEISLAPPVFKDSECTLPLPRHSPLLGPYLSPDVVGFVFLFCPFSLALR